MNQTICFKMIKAEPAVKRPIREYFMLLFIFSALAVSPALTKYIILLITKLIIARIPIIDNKKVKVLEIILDKLGASSRLVGMFSPLKTIDKISFKKLGPAKASAKPIKEPVQIFLAVSIKESLPVLVAIKYITPLMTMKRTPRKAIILRIPVRMVSRKPVIVPVVPMGLPKERSKAQTVLGIINKIKIKISKFFLLIILSA